MKQKRTGIQLIISIKLLLSTPVRTVPSKLRLLLKQLFYWQYTWRDETSSCDPEGRWQGGSECYMRNYTCWLPRWLKDADIDNYICDHMEDDKGFWL